MVKGKVKWFSQQKGYGFITPSDGGEDVFVHFSSIQLKDKGQRNLREGEIVSYELAEGPKGMQALNVRKF